MNNVFLTGFMATGKTAVGRALAERLARTFVDLDVEIERAAGMAVQAIFARFGEGDFRARERGELERACALERAVVATGGGIVTDPRNRSAMRASGRIVCLSAVPEIILRRLGAGADRPLLADAAAREERVRSLLGERGQAYADADVTFDTSDLPPSAVVDSIVAWLATAGPAEAVSG